MAGDDVRVELHQAEIDALKHHPGIRQRLLAVGGDVATDAARNAPHRTGAGAASIHPEPVDEPGEATVRVSWDRAHFYLFFHERGTQHLPEHPFLEPALDRYAQLGRSV